MGYSREMEDYVRVSELDYMTGLLNRRSGIAHITKFIDDNPDVKCGFIIFDGDCFKKINNTYGHQYGDRVIVSCGHEIERRFKDKGIVIRLGGDEFLVFYKHTSRHEIEHKLDNFMNVCKKANILSDKQMQFTFSVGVAMYPDYGDSFDSLMENADEALYKAKYDGRGCYRIYEPSMNMVHRDQFMFDMDQLSKSIPGGFFVCEANGDQRLLYAGDSMVDMFGCSSRADFLEYVDYSFKGIVHPDDFDYVEKEIHNHQVQVNGKLNNMDYIKFRIVCKNGNVKTVDDFSHLVYDRNYGLVYYVFLLDFSEYILKDQMIGIA